MPVQNTTSRRGSVVEVPADPSALQESQCNKPCVFCALYQSQHGINTSSPSAMNAGCHCMLHQNGDTDFSNKGQNEARKWPEFRQHSSYRESSSLRDAGQQLTQRNASATSHLSGRRRMSEACRSVKQPKKPEGARDPENRQQKKQQLTVADENPDLPDRNADSNDGTPIMHDCRRDVEESLFLSRGSFHYHVEPSTPVTDGGKNQHNNQPNINKYSDQPLKASALGADHHNHNRSESHHRNHRHYRSSISTQCLTHSDASYSGDESYCVSFDEVDLITPIKTTNPNRRLSAEREGQKHERRNSSQSKQHPDRTPSASSQAEENHGNRRSSVQCERSCSAFRKLPSMASASSNTPEQRRSSLNVSPNIKPRRRTESIATIEYNLIPHFKPQITNERSRPLDPVPAFSTSRFNAVVALTHSRIAEEDSGDSELAGVATARLAAETRSREGRRSSRAEGGKSGIEMRVKPTWEEWKKEPPEIIKQARNLPTNVELAENYPDEKAVCSSLPRQLREYPCTSNPINPTTKVLPTEKSRRRSDTVSFAPLTDVNRNKAHPSHESSAELAAGIERRRKSCNPGGLTTISSSAALKYPDPWAANSVVAEAQDAVPRSGRRRCSTMSMAMGSPRKFGSDWQNEFSDSPLPAQVTANNGKTPLPIPPKTAQLNRDQSRRHSCYPVLRRGSTEPGMQKFSCTRTEPTSPQQPTSPSYQLQRVFTRSATIAIGSLPGEYSLRQLSPLPFALEEEGNSELNSKSSALTDDESDSDTRVSIRQKGSPRDDNIPCPSDASGRSCRSSALSSRHSLAAAGYSPRAGHRKHRQSDSSASCCSSYATACPNCDGAEDVRQVAVKPKQKRRERRKELTSLMSDRTTKNPDDDLHFIKEIIMANAANLAPIKITCDQQQQQPQQPPTDRQSAQSISDSSSNAHIVAVNLIGEAAGRRFAQGVPVDVFVSTSDPMSWRRAHAFQVLFPPNGKLALKRGNQVQDMPLHAIYELNRNPDIIESLVPDPPTAAAASPSSSSQSENWLRGGQQLCGSKFRNGSIFSDIKAALCHFGGGQLESNHQDNNNGLSLQEEVNRMRLRMKNSLLVRTRLQPSPLVMVFDHERDVETFIDLVLFLQSYEGSVLASLINPVPLKSDASFTLIRNVAKFQHTEASSSTTKKKQSSFIRMLLASSCCLL